MAIVDSADLLSISDANKLGISALVRDAEAGRERILLRNNRPVAAVIGMDQFEQLQTLQDDLLDIVLTSARMLTTSDRRTSLDEVLTFFGFTREQLAELPE